jgi:hypothetical protein
MHFYSSDSKVAVWLLVLAALALAAQFLAG